MESDVERIFHFTKESEKLESIIINKEFWVCFSIENHCFLNNAYKTNISCDMFESEVIKNILAYPMVCFCDIPMVRHKYHAKKYGGFGIGMKRKWAIDINISPVQYVHENCQVAKHWQNIFSKMDDIKKVIPSDYKDSEDFFFNEIFHLATYIKPYSKGDDIFYNEREWRYSPPPDEWGQGAKRFLIKNENTDEISDYKQKYNSMKSQYTLKFDYEDIDCLIVPSNYYKNKFSKILIDNCMPDIPIYTPQTIPFHSNE
jgi:hypothetical protein